MEMPMASPSSKDVSVAFTAKPSMLVEKQISRWNTDCSSSDLAHAAARRVTKDNNAIERFIVGKLLNRDNPVGIITPDISCFVGLNRFGGDIDGAIIGHIHKCLLIYPGRDGR